MTNFSLKTKILGLGLFLSGVSVCVGLAAYTYLNRVTAEYSFIPEKVMPKLENVNEMFLEYRRLRIVVRTLGLQGVTKEVAENSINEVSHVIEEYEKARKNPRYCET